MSGNPGLAELLTGPATFEESLQTNGVPNLWFLPRGSSTGHPGDLMLGPALEQVLNRCRKEFDYVLVDSSPVFTADDVTTLAPKLDGILFVVRSGFSRLHVAREALQLLIQRQARIAGLVFNRVDASARSYNYYKYAEYYKFTCSERSVEPPAPPKMHDREERINQGTEDCSGVGNRISKPTASDKEAPRDP